MWKLPELGLAKPWNQRRKSETVEHFHSCNTCRAQKDLQKCFFVGPRHKTVYILGVFLLDNKNVSYWSNLHSFFVA
jgi:hypothetical protein